MQLRPPSDLTSVAKTYVAALVRCVNSTAACGVLVPAMGSSRAIQRLTIMCVSSLLLFGIGEQHDEAIVMHFGLVWLCVRVELLCCNLGCSYSCPDLPEHSLKSDGR